MNAYRPRKFTYLKAKGDKRASSCNPGVCYAPACGWGEFLARLCLKSTPGDRGSRSSGAEMVVSAVGCVRFMEFAPPRWPEVAALGHG